MLYLLYKSIERLETQTSFTAQIRNLKINGVYNIIPLQLFPSKSVRENLCLWQGRFVWFGWIKKDKYLVKNWLFTRNAVPVWATLNKSPFKCFFMDVAQ